MSPSEWKFSAGNLPGITDFYSRNGFAGLTGLFSKAEIGELSQVAHECIRAGQIKTAEADLTPTFDLIFVHPLFEKIVRDPRMVELAKSVLGQDVELLRSVMHTKIPGVQKPGMRMDEWHQDFSFVPHTNYDSVTIGIHLDDVLATSGPMRVIPGSQTRGPLSHCQGEEFIYKCTEDIAVDLKNTVSLTGEAGLVTLHSCLLLHRSDLKTNEHFRRFATFQYRAQDCAQLAGPILKDTGYQVMPRAGKVNTARFPDGSRVELRGRKGRLYDVYQKLAPDR